MAFRILYQDEHLVAIDKPAGFHVHPPEDSTHRIPRSINCLHLLKTQLEQYIYPVHRLDRATSGVLLFALQKPAAKSICDAFQQHEIQKTYVCVARGWTNPAGMIDHPLRSDALDSPEKLPSRTTYTQIGTIELPEAIGRYPTARYSLLRVTPYSGRRHQIRRHFDSLAHPLVGDTVYGEGAHNRFFREKLGIQGLLLKAYSLEFKHPVTQSPMRIVSRWNGTWHSVFDLFGVCPWVTSPDLL